MTIQKIDLAAGERLTEKQIVDYINNHDTTEFQTHSDYWEGANTKIEDRKEDSAYTDEDHTINNVIPVPHARKIAKTVVGYAFKPGSITYTCKDESYMEAVKDIFDKNSEEFKTAQNGLYMSSRGISYELQYTKMNIAGQAEYRFTRIDPAEVIPFHNYDIEPELVCCIRYYTRSVIDEITLKEKEVIYADVYYQDVIQYWIIQDNKGKERLSEDEHLMGAVPWVIYENNDELQPDYWAVKDLIDAYDVLMSDSMNEFEKFAYAYLRLVNFRLRDEDKKEMKTLRAFEDLPEKDAVTYLTKDINTEFISFMTNLIEELIFKYAHVYDPTDENFSGVASGIALAYKLFDTETSLMSFKESYHRKGLERRFEFIEKFLSLKGITTTKKIKIHYMRNKPNNLAEIADTAIKLMSVLSEETVLSLFPADIVPDIKEEIRKKEEKREKEKKINLDNIEGV
jgi:SPP1 family phage portal protein